MAKLIIRGGNRLEGSLQIPGAKNSVLPILAASLSVSDSCVLENCPNLSDVGLALSILRNLGCFTKQTNSTIEVDSSQADGDQIPKKLMCEMRSSIIFLGAMLSKNGHAVLSAPGGCDLGPRPIDLHLEVLRRMGAEIREECGILECHAKRRLRGIKMSFPFVSVGATENALIAAATADGTTHLYHAACEPEILDLALFLNRCGAKIYGAGTPQIRIEGVKTLHGCRHRIIPDRIVAATYLASAAITGGDLLLSNTAPKHLQAVLPCLQQAGAQLSVSNDQIRLKANHRPCALKPIITAPYPAFPTDAQAPIMALCSVAQGTTLFEETIFRDRFRHVPELVRMGANINTEGYKAWVFGVSKLHGAQVSATDLRGGAALVGAALGAEGETKISEIHHIDRGYESIEEAFSALGGCIKRVEAWQIKEEKRIIHPAFAI